MLLVSDRRYGSALQVDDDVQQVRAGLEDFEFAVKPRCDSIIDGQLVRKIDVRLLERSGLTDAETALPGKSTCTFPESIPTE